MHTTSTAATAKLFFAFTLANPATVSSIADHLKEVLTPPVIERTTTRVQPDIARALGSINAAQSTPTDAIGNLVEVGDVDRATTPREQLIGELRRWALLEANWDGEGATVPSIASLKEAVAFAGLLEENALLPEPMLHGSGHAGLFWNDGIVYADLEFLGDGRVAYFVARQGDKHKGVLKFDSQKMPAVFPALLSA